MQHITHEFYLPDGQISLYAKFHKPSERSCFHFASHDHDHFICQFDIWLETKISAWRTLEHETEVCKTFYLLRIKVRVVIKLTITAQYTVTKPKTASPLMLGKLLILSSSSRGMFGVLEEKNKNRSELMKQKRSTTE